MPCEPELDAIPPLLTTADIELELRRLVRRLVAGTRLLQGRFDGAGGVSVRKVLLDLEVDGVRCLLTQRPTADRRNEVHLSPRECEVARMVAMGLTNTAIAGKLAVSPWTVSTHLRRIFAKLDVATRAEMVAVLASAETQEVGTDLAAGTSQSTCVRVTRTSPSAQEPPAPTADLNREAEIWFRRGRLVTP
jgi:DNA-binding CsgD family transcriptional regulator